ncbi:hypothetical protein CANCADRAFT_124029 [Tortispora caseinolytica NRRL Y-17796]|uniref:Uncharacterized protein n=1 Tax=Tortispora caseinolytica NRRL Y-17796 TaxID=767744 RepID=A0A1E4T9U5_9ASCO|nr:hypothetical protein CANCADRAFT_124029 [Tortispora caseinolytica NRRL Y-17796]
MLTKNCVMYNETIQFHRSTKRCNSRKARPKSSLVLTENRRCSPKYKQTRSGIISRAASS